MTQKIAKNATYLSPLHLWKAPFSASITQNSTTSRFQNNCSNADLLPFIGPTFVEPYGNSPKI